MLLCVALLGSRTALAQWKILDINAKINMRAVHTVSPNTCWIGGSDGTVLKTTNAGKTWNTFKIATADSLDFRDIYAFDKQTAIAMSAGLAESGESPDLPYRKRR